MIIRSLCLVVLLLITGTPTSAQLPQVVVDFSPEGFVITKKTLADCKRQARIRKLNYIRQREFVRKCVGL